MQYKHRCTVVCYIKLVIVSGMIILVSIKMTVWTRSMHIYPFRAEPVRNCCGSLIFLQCRQAF